MSAPYQNVVNDGEGDARDSQTGQQYSFLAPWFTRGYTSHLGAGGQFVNTPLIPSVPGENTYAQFPSDQAFSVVNQNYFSSDGNPLGGFLTFMPSDDVLITENGVSWRLPARLAGSETWGAVDSGVSPWAFSMEGSGKIYIWQGLLVARLFACDNPNVETLRGQPLVYHVAEHFLGGYEYDISVPTSSAVLDLNSLIVPGTLKRFKYDPIFPLGTPEICGDLLTPELPTDTISHLATEYLQCSITAMMGVSQVDVSIDEIDFAFMQYGNIPNMLGAGADGSSWIQGAWVLDGPLAEVLVGSGAGGLPLAVGQYQVWTRLIDDPQTFVEKIGFLIIT
jgi:hypothetical protein